MTPAEYVQLKAFARQDGALLALLWVGSFVSYILGLSSPLLSMLSILLMVLTPFFVYRRVQNFRDCGRDGILSFARGWAFVVFVFFYAGLLFAIVQYAYFAFIDKGYLMESMIKMLSTPEAKEMIAQSGMTDTMSESVHEIQTMRPIDLSLNVLTTNILIGMLLGLPIAAVAKRGVTPGNQMGNQQ